MKNKTTFLNWLSVYGSEKIILGADTINGRIAIQGWLEKSKYAINDFVSEYIKEGVSYVICTDISKDGMLEGPAFDLYKKMILSNASQLKLIASGGISNINELPKLKSLGCEGVIIGKAIYENKISMKQLEQFIVLNHA